MRRSLQFLIICVAVAAIVVVALLHPGGWECIVSVMGAGVIILVMWVWWSLDRTDRVVQTGMELIGSQEFSNRLVETGLPETDRIVSLFNTMIDSLRGERIKNMEQENFTSLLTHASPMGVMMLDFDRKVSMVNPAFLKITDIGHEKDVLGKKVADIDVSLVRDMAAVALGKSEVIRGGNVMMYRCYHLSFIRNGARCEFYLLESLTEEVMKAEREAYEKVIRTISHEINNTMGGVRTVIQAMVDTADSDEVVDVLESCDDRCEQMCAFVSAYADVVRLPEPALRKTDLNAEVHRLMPFLGTVVGDGVSLQFSPSPSPVFVMADTGMLQQVIVNIIKNAAESIDTQDGRIIVATGSDNRHSTLTITNNGIPISDEVSRNIFRPFFTTKKSGRGIGLTLIAEILTRHNARFSLHTTPDGLTSFRIVF